MPSNSPAVNSLWLPAIALKTPVIIKPGREEPWTPFRLIQAFIAAGAPPDAFGFYPTDHEGSGEVMKLCGRALIFGDAGTVAQYRDNPRFSVHGPGFSKILIGNDEIENWPQYIDLIAGFHFGKWRTLLRECAAPSSFRNMPRKLPTRLRKCWDRSAPAAPRR